MSLFVNTQIMGKFQTIGNWGLGIGSNKFQKNIFIMFNYNTLLLEYNHLTFVQNNTS